MKNKEFEKIVKNINTALEKKKISKNSLAKLSGLPISTVGRILSGERNFTIDKMIPLARALDIELSEFFTGIEIKTNKHKAVNIELEKQYLAVGIMSIGRRRFTCITNEKNQVIGTSALSGDLDLAESTTNLLDLIKTSIYAAIENSKQGQYKKIYPNIINDEDFLKHIDIKLVTQSYEFMERRKQFIYKAKQIFNSVIHMPDWQISYLADFNGKEKGISLVVDKGVSLSYEHKGLVKKIGGWKFPVYDFGGENWLGIKTIHHTIEAAEGLIPNSELADEILANHGGKIEKITETCFHSGPQNTDVYCLFAIPLIRLYLLGNKEAAEIINEGFRKIQQLLTRAECDFTTPPLIAIHGSLTRIYQRFFKKERLAQKANDKTKVFLLSTITRDFLTEHGINYIDA